MMWQEARKQEKKIRGMLVDYKRRAERRKDYYEKIKADPTQFIQLHGRPCKIHLDPAVAIAGDSPANMMSWQGNHDILIDRFDVRAHLDFIPENTSKQDEEEEPSQEERYINYERYRILAQNDFLGVSEDKFLQQLALEEQFGPVEKTEPPPIEGKKKVPGATIAYNYSEGTPSTSVAVTVGVSGGGAGEPPVAAADKDTSDEDNDNEEEDDEDSDIDFDLCVDVNKISSAQAHEMNAAALSYGMCSNDFFSFLTRDVEEAETLKLAREREEEKAMFSGRKSRRERRAFREKKLIGRKLSPPSYAASKAAPIADLIRTVTKSRSRSRSRSPSPPNAGMIQYITSFGGDEVPLEPPPPQIIKTSVHASKEDDKMYKRTVRYRSSRSPELARRRSVERAYGARRRSRSHSPSWKSRSPPSRTVRYRSKSRSPARSVESSREQSHNNTNYRKRPSGSKSRSPTPVQRIVKKSASPQPVRSVEVPAPPVITRYYGRRKNESSSSELDLSDSDDKNDQNSEKNSSDKNIQAVGNAGGRFKPGASSSASSKLSLQERLKKKRQALINRQYKADKKAERLRQEKAEQERQDREDEMREISIKMRRRERQKRHQYYELDDTNAAEMSDEDGLSSVSSGSGSDKQGSDSEQRSRSRSSKKSNRTQDSDRGRNSRERDRSRERGKDSWRERGRSAERDRERWSRRREEERPWRDRSRERTRDTRDTRDRSRDKYRRDRDREWSRDRDRDRDRDRERYFSHRSRERDSSESGTVVVKAKRPLVDY